MRSSHAWSGLVLALSGALLACGMPPPADGGTDVVNRPDGDAMMMPPPGDASDAGDARVDGDAGGLCRGIATENLNTLGMMMGAVTRYTGTNTMAADSTTAGVQTTGITGCDYATTRQRIFSYTLHAHSAIRVTTSNPGTTFDTTLALISMCSGRAVLACNDDDATMGATVRTSLVVSNVRDMGTTLYIAVGGFVNAGMRDPMSESGTFELTVEELTPQMNGAACDVRGLTNVCDATSTCVGSSILAEMGTCRANGTVAGSRCDAMGMCSGTGLACDSTNGICYETVADGMPCQRFTDAWQRCGMTSTCVNLQRGSVFGTCRANGTVAGSACTATNTCPGAGLQCQLTGTASICLNAVAAGAACRTWDDACPTDQQCTPANVLGTPGTCRAVGSAAGIACGTGATCTSPLMCTTRGTTMVCTETGTTGAACGVYTDCASMGTCYLNDPASRITGICYAANTLGGPCTSPTGCPAGSTCSNAMATPDNPGRCLATIAAGMGCTIFGTGTCAMGSSCVPTNYTSTSAPLAGTCVADGGRGGACRASGARCDAGLTCSAMTGAGLCQAAATTSCDTEWGTDHCATGQWCRATAARTNGTCVAPTMEMENNDNVTMPQVVTAPATVSGALTRFDLDCYQVSVPAGQAVFARVNYPNGLCQGDANVTQLALDLYDPAGRLLGGDTNSGSFGCPRINGAATHQAWARSTAGGTHTICVRNNAQGRAAIPGYVVDIALVP